jgi:hypothetical protein
VPWRDDRIPSTGGDDGRLRVVARDWPCHCYSASPIVGRRLLLSNGATVCLHVSGRGCALHETTPTGVTLYRHVLPWWAHLPGQTERYLLREYARFLRDTGSRSPA